MRTANVLTFLTNAGVRFRCIAAHPKTVGGAREFISHNVLIKWFKKSTPPQIVNLVFFIVKVINKLTILLGS